MPLDVDNKPGKLVVGMIYSKHPDERVMDTNNIPHCESHPDLIEILVADDTIELVVKCLQVLPVCQE